MNPPRKAGRVLVLLLAGAAMPLTTAAQEVEPDDAEAVVREDTTDLRASRRAAAANPAPRLWGGELFLTGAVDSNIERDAEEELVASGITAGGLLAIQNRSRGPSLLADYRGMLHAYAGTERWDRTTHRIRLFHRMDLGGPWSVETAAVGATGLLTVEYRLAEQVSLAPQLQYQPNRTHRLRAHAALRHRWYRDETGSAAWGPYGGGDYRYRWGSWHYADLAFRFEQNRADLPRRNYDRSSYTAAYTRPLGPRDRVRLRLIYRDVRFEDRALPTLDGTIRDSRWNPSVLYVHDFPGPLRADTEYRWSARRSNDVRRDFESHRLSLTLRYQW
jgi:hypothetical protein